MQAVSHVFFSGDAESPSVQLLVITSCCGCVMGDGLEAAPNTFRMEIIAPMSAIQAEARPERKVDVYVSMCQSRADVSR